MYFILLDPCDAGYRSDNGYLPCTACSENTYQPDEGQTTCIYCPQGQSSPPASTLLSQCIGEYEIISMHVFLYNVLHI